LKATAVRLALSPDVLSDRERRTGWAARLASLPVPGRLLISLALVVVVGAGDHLTGADAAFTLLYLAPIGLGAWTTGVGAGLALGALSAASCALTSALAHPPPLLAWNLGGQLAGFIVFALLVARVRRRLERERQFARTDPLTAVANRRSFLEATAAEVARTRRYGRPFTVAYLDLDELKTVNDCLGHEAGDAVLRLVASTLRENLRAIDRVARLGGDEFALLLPEMDGDTARAAMPRLRQAVLAAMDARGWRVTFSLGVVSFLSPPASVDAILKLPDDLMYSVKARGKDGIAYRVHAGAIASVAADPASAAQRPTVFAQRKPRSAHRSEDGQSRRVVERSTVGKI
jgi:diguanylate cyclase (GGDEF)-like protein